MTFEDSATRPAASLTCPISRLNCPSIKLKASARFPNISSVTAPRLVKSPLLTSPTSTRNSISRRCSKSRSPSVCTRPVIRSSMALKAWAICPNSSVVCRFARASRWPEAACVATSAICVTLLEIKRATTYPKVTPSKMATMTPAISTLRLLSATT